MSTQDQTQTPALLPFFLKVAGRSVVIVGAGAVALQKVEALLPTGAELTLIAPWACDEVLSYAQAGRLHWIQSTYEAGSLNDALLVIAATNDVAVNHRVYDDAKALSKLVNAVDDPPYCDFYFGSVVRRGPLQVAISTEGESPSVAQRLKREIDAALDDSTGEWLLALGRLRREVIATHPAGLERNALLARLAEREVCDAPGCLSRRMAQVETGKQS